jgi:hypothetical protein
MYGNPLQITTYTTTGTAATYALTWEPAAFSFTMPEPTSSDIVSATSQYPAEVNQAATGSVSVLETLSLPDETSYQFCYDPNYGTIDKISFPTGGYVRFVYGIRTSGTYNMYTPNGISTIGLNRFAVFS